MEASVTHQQFSLRLLKTIQLPHLKGEPGPLHTILQDKDQNIYYVDEINHSLVSLNATGEVRWHSSKQGNKSGEFYYPKGIDLGWINADGNKIECIAACDSWNNRIQFFDRDGHWLTAWNCAGDISFKEVVDIRFVNLDRDSGSGNFCWVILDRGNHCIFELDPGGSIIHKSGRAFPERLEWSWQIPLDRPNPRELFVDRIRECLPYDPLFMPLRIFGSSPKALFIWEPKSSRLKQAIAGNMIPLWIELPLGAEWIGADEEGLLCFNKYSGMLGSYSPEARDWRLTRIDGEPIASRRSSEKIWIQKCSSVQQWILDYGERESSKHSWILFGLRDEIATITRTGLAASNIRPLQEAMARMRELSEKTVEDSAAQVSDAAVVSKLKNSLASCSRAYSEALLQLKPFAYASFLGFLKIQVLHSVYPAAEDRLYLQQALDRVKTAFKPIADLFKEFLLFRDEWLSMCRIKGFSGDADTIAMRVILLKEYSDAQILAISELAEWLWSTSQFSDRLPASAKSRMP
jgi:hypothetical protein